MNVNWTKCNHFGTHTNIKSCGHMKIICQLYLNLNFFWRVVQSLTLNLSEKKGFAQGNKSNNFKVAVKIQNTSVIFQTFDQPLSVWSTRYGEHLRSIILQWRGVCVCVSSIRGCVCIKCFTSLQRVCELDTMRREFLKHLRNTWGNMKMLLRK